MGEEGLLLFSFIAGMIATLALFTFVYFRGLALIEVFQSGNYDAATLLKRVVKDRLFEKYATLIILLSYIGWAFLDFLAPTIAAPMFFAFAIVALAMGAFKDQKRIIKAGGEAGKKPRDRKILYLYLILTATYFATLFTYQGEINIMILTFTFLIFFQAPPIFIIAANFIVRPFLKNAG
jgi:hypothetical protein